MLLLGATGKSATSAGAELMGTARIAIGTRAAPPPRPITTRPDLKLSSLNSLASLPQDSTQTVKPSEWLSDAIVGMKGCSLGM